jgi:two-component system, NarL family, nitrate/nitrite response regulator NarL
VIVGPASHPKSDQTLDAATAEGTRVYLIDDHPVVRQGLARAIAQEPGMTVVGQSATAVEAMQEIGAISPDVVLVDLNLPDRDGIDLILGLRAKLKDAKLLVLSCYDDEMHVAEALRAGAQGYVVKTSSLGEILDGIRQVAIGGTPLSADVAGAVVRAMHRPADAASGTLDSLSPRERQVFRLLAAGLSTRDAAARLDLSPKTVETHRMRIYEKLGCASAVDLTRLAVRQGLIDP